MLSLKPWHGPSIGVGIQGRARSLRNHQAGKDLLGLVMLALQYAYPHKPFGLNLGQLTKKRGTDTSKESVAFRMHRQSSVQHHAIRVASTL